MHRSPRERKKTKREAEGEDGEIAVEAGVVAAEGVEGFRDKKHRRTFCLLHGACVLLLAVNQMYECYYHFRTTYTLPSPPENALWNYSTVACGDYGNN